MSGDETLRVLSATELHPAKSTEPFLVDIERAADGQYSVDFSPYPEHRFKREKTPKTFSVDDVFTPISRVKW